MIFDQVSDPEKMSVLEDRDSLFPIQFPDLWKYYKQQLSTFWTSNEIDLSQDPKDYERASPEIKQLLEVVLSFFAFADKLVMKNVSENFLSDARCPEAVSFYNAQNLIETIHAEVYSDCIVTIITDKKRQREIQDSVQTYDSVKIKKSFCEEWLQSERPFAERLVAFASVEGLLFSASFASIYYLKELNIFSGTTVANELISRDENLHRDFAVALFHHLPEPDKCSIETIKDIVISAVDTEMLFVSECIPESGLKNFYRKDLQDYVRFLADILLTDLGCPKHFNVSLPKNLAFMNKMSIETKGNFFETRITSYQKFEPAATLELDDDDF